MKIIFIYIALLFIFMAYACKPQVQPETQIESKPNSNVATFDLLPEKFDPIKIIMNYGNGLYSGTLVLEQDKVVRGDISEYNGCDYSIDSGEWTLDNENKSIIVDTKGRIANSCLTGGKPFSQKFILKLTKTLKKEPDSVDCKIGKVVECTLN